MVETVRNMLWEVKRTARRWDERFEMWMERNKWPVMLTVGGALAVHIAFKMF